MAGSADHEDSAVYAAYCSPQECHRGIEWAWPYLDRRARLRVICERVAGSRYALGPYTPVDPESIGEDEPSLPVVLDVVGPL